MDSLLSFFSALLRVLISFDFMLIFLLSISFVTFYKFRRFSRFLSAFVVSFFVLLAFFPLGEWLAYPLENQFQTNPRVPDKITGVIMLSGGEEPMLSRIWGQVEFDRAVERNIYFLSFIRKYPEAKQVFSGGGNPDYKGAHKILMNDLMEMLGIEGQDVIFEDKSRNTLGSVKNLHALLTPKEGEHWILITSALHMKRADLIFKSYDWKVIPFPVDHITHKDNLMRVNINFTENLLRLKVAFKEWLGIFLLEAGLQ